MESLEEERLVQMVHDFIESGISLGSLSSSSEINHLNRSTSILLQDVLENVTVSEMEIFTRVLNYLKKNRFDENNVIAKRHLMMELRMDGYDASLCKSSWDSSMNCAGGDYEYIDVLMVDEEGVTVRLIVDIDFKSQFELARPTVTYSELSNSLPSIFVGNEDKLRTVITLICSAAKDSLKERGLHIPPWRTTSYMQSKWLSCCKKESNICLPVFSEEISRHDKESKAQHHCSKNNNWAPPKVDPQRRNLTGSQDSGLSDQVSSLRWCEV